MFAGEKFTSSYHIAMSLPETVADIFRNVFLFFPFREQPRLTPPAWALTVEIFFYILIGLGLSKNKKITCYWFIFSLAYHVIALTLVFGWYHRYFTIFAASLPFATGAMIFHYKTVLINKFNKLNLTSKYLPYLGYTLLIFNWAAGRKTGLAESYFFYSNYLICSLMLLVLIYQKNIMGISQKLDSKLGDFSYPIYLLHYQAGIIAILVASSVGIELERGNLTLVIWSLPVLFFISWLVNQFVEEYIQKVRTKIKNKRSVQSQVAK
jgi:peptidoglycan/LPS O-acetylase OafA/YrhL